MASKAPWPEFNGLKSYLADGHPPDGQHSASSANAAILDTRLESEGLIQTADPELLALAARYTGANGEGIPTLRLPETFPERTYLDISVAGRKLISKAGMAQIAQAEGLVHGEAEAPTCRK